MFREAKPKSGSNFHKNTKLFPLKEEKFSHSLYSFPDNIFYFDLNGRPSDEEFG